MDDPRVGFVAGSNLFGISGASDASYYFSKIPMIWGWASWRRVWTHYDFELCEWPKLKSEGWLESVAQIREYDHWLRSFDAMHAGKIDTWDYQVVFLAFRQSFLCVIPHVNLISNIGFRSDATHTKKNSKDANLPTQSLVPPLNHPSAIGAERDYERAYIRHHTNSRFWPTLLRRIKSSFGQGLA